MGGIIQLIGRKPTQRKAKAVVEDSMLEVMTKELSILGTTKVKESDIFARYVISQNTKAQAAKDAMQLRDQHQSFKERE